VWGPGSGRFSAFALCRSLPAFAGPWCTERARKGQRPARERSPTRGVDDAGRVPPVAAVPPSSAGGDRPRASVRPRTLATSSTAITPLFYGSPGSLSLGSVLTRPDRTSAPFRDALPDKARATRALNACWLPPGAPLFPGHPNPPPGSERAVKRRAEGQGAPPLSLQPLQSAMVHVQECPPRRTQARPPATTPAAGRRYQ
jgi:hypothetical protein